MVHHPFNNLENFSKSILVKWFKSVQLVLTVKSLCQGIQKSRHRPRLALDPVLRQVVAGRAVDANAAFASQIGRFQTEVLATPDNRTALADMSGQWIERVQERKPPKWITVDGGYG